MPNPNNVVWKSLVGHHEPLEGEDISTLFDTPQTETTTQENNNNSNNSTSDN